MARLGIVTATTNRERAQPCIGSWFDHAAEPFAIEISFNGGPFGDYLGTVRAFRQGVDALLAQEEVEVIACLHDDLEIIEVGWDQRVLRHFDRQPSCGLAGFGGAIGLGDDDLYQKPYAPVQLARRGFRSNLVDAEQHGVRSLFPERVACLDGFSQVGRREFWEGYVRDLGKKPEDRVAREQRPWTYLDKLGVVHHFYDGMLGCLAARYGWETWYLPIACRHYGGQTAVGDPGYQAWARTRQALGDHGFWEAAHAIGYEVFRDVLPLRV